MKKISRLSMRLFASASLCLAACVAPDDRPAGPVVTHAVTRAPIELNSRAQRRRPRPQTVPPTPPPPVTPPPVTPPAATTHAVDTRLLVVSADGNEAVLPAIVQTLDGLGTPYTVWIARAHPGALTAEALGSSAGGHYQGVILTTGSLPYSADGGATWASALSAAEWAALAAYEAAYGVRQASWYTFPTPDFGFGAATAVDTSITPVYGSLTTAGRAALPALASALRLPIRNAYTYLAAPVADGTATPLVVDDAGHALMLVRTLPDGRESLAMTFDGNPNLIHSLVLGSSVVGWVTRGVFLGERHTYVSPQIDDIFYESDLYPAGTYRISGADFDRARAWQAAHQREPVFAGLRLSMVFNGEGATGVYDPDPLTPVAVRGQADFHWINHTFTHAELDGAAYASTLDELSLNIAEARSLGLTRFSVANLVTPGITGLTTADVMRAAFDVGVRYVVTDTSQPGGAAPSPNAGRYSPLVPAILQIPRRPTNLFYNVSTPTEWTAEYNSFYRTYWGRNLTVAEIIDYESDLLLSYLLRGENAPWMFHEANLRAYSAGHSLLTDLLDAAFAKYAALLADPVLSPAMDDLGRRVADRMAYDGCGVTATLDPHASLTLHATGSCSVPITGATTGAAVQPSAGATVTYVPIHAGETVVIPLR